MLQPRREFRLGVDQNILRVSGAGSDKNSAVSAVTPHHQSIRKNVYL
jgi:hypothetical protein